MKKSKNHNNTLYCSCPVSDGKYIGEYSVPPVFVKVEVTVERHQSILKAIENALSREK